MYVESFKLSTLPFSLNPDPRFLYRSAEHARAETFVKSECARPGGRVAIIGEPGIGKTLLLQSLVEGCGRDFLPVQVNYPLESTTEFLRAMLSQLDAPLESESQDAFRAFGDYLAQGHVSGRKVLLVVDEAHGLSRHVLASLLQLAGNNAPHAGDLRIVIAGEAELEGLLTGAARERRVPRLCEQAHLAGLADTETGSYVEHRLRVAGAEDRRIFRREAYDTIFRYSGGNPRRINILCDAALSIACARNSGSVSQAELRHAIEELGWTAMSAAPDPSTSPPRRTESHAHVSAPTGPNGHVGPARLYVAYKGKPVAHLELTRGRASIGRAPENDLQIVSDFISRRHCQVLTTNKGSMLVDVSSTNGVYMNDRRVRRHWLRDGDVLTIGDHELRYARLDSQDSSAT